MSRFTLYALRLTLLALFAIAVIAATAPAPSGTLQGFGQISARAGWVLMDGRLFLTEDDGQNWRDITSPNAPDAALWAVTFAGAQNGWAVSITGDERAPQYTLYRTEDSGQTWQTHALNLFAPDEVAAIASVAHLQFLDERVGWLSVKQMTSSNFSLGTLFKTEDGGETWTRLTQPIGDAPQFTDALNGTLAGGPAGDEFYRTSDGGHTWARQKGVVPSAPVVLRADLSEVSSAEAGSAWAKSTDGQCADGQCTLTVEILKTSDGGQTWAPLDLPLTLAPTVFSAPVVSSPSAPEAIGALTQPFAGQGFDTCNPPSMSDMQTWFNTSPYKIWNLYIGGSSRGCNAANNAGVTAYSIAQWAAQGWKFIPTWVGPQAACTSYPSRMSYDPTTAYNEGVAQANLAVATANTLGLTLGDSTGSIIYYDLEAYSTSNTACHEAAKSFIAGWTARLHALSNQSGLYSLACLVDDFALISDPPDGVWFARWSYAGYTPNPSLSDACIPASAWANHQRIRQYAGDHSEAWGGVSLNIDSNALDGIVSTLNGGGGNGNCLPGPYQAALFEHTDYAGQCTLRTLGTHANAAALGLSDNSVSSVRLGLYVKATLCSDPNLGGACETLAGDDPDLSNNAVGNDTLSSMKVEIKYALNCAPAAHEVALFVDANYAGPCVVRGAGDYANAVAMGLPDNTVTSIKVGADVQATLCASDDFSGTCQTFSADDTNLNNNTLGDNTTSSMRVSWRPAAHPLELYQDVNYANGYCYLLVEAWINLTGVCAMYNDTVSSLKLQTGWSARVYQDLDLGGASACLTASDADLTNNTYEGGGAVDNSISSLQLYHQSACPAQVPAAPSALTATSATSATVTLGWLDHSPDETGFRVYVDDSLAITLSANVTTYTVTNLACASDYRFDVSAYNVAGESTGAGEVRALTAPCPAAPDGPTLLSPAHGAAVSLGQPFSLTWSASLSATEYYAELWDGPTLVLTSGWTSDTAWAVSSAPSGLYQWRVKARVEVAESGWSETRAFILRYRVYLPLTTRQQQQALPLVNGGFEDGPQAGWAPSSARGQTLILTSNGLDPLLPAPHTGGWLARLGWVNNEIAILQQTVTVPIAQPYLSYWQWLKSEEEQCIWDFASVLVNGVVVDGYGLCVDTDSTAWAQHTVDLSAYAGQTITLQLRLDNDGSLLSEWVLDDVAFQATP